MYPTTPWQSSYVVSNISAAVPGSGAVSILDSRPL